ncbi:unnamed protein product [Echinostoma caproni]|uniref:N-acetyltransferase n=1 Tax=Echinostoma caproni TaxID=27848 RepID=A0A183B1S7_9TREM|nr:unnamed protein product [Echinostoma caproni]
MSGTPNYQSTDTQCFERIDYPHVAMVELSGGYAHPEGFGEALWCRIKVRAGQYTAFGVIYCTPAGYVPELLASIQRRGVPQTDRPRDGRNVWRSFVPDMRQAALLTN